MSSAVPAILPDLLQEARSLMAAGRVDEAAGLFHVLSEAEPRHVEARNALAIVALRSGDAAGARAQLDVALAVAPEDPLTLSHLAQLQQMEGDVAAARRTYAAILEREPALYSVRLAYAQLLEDGGEGQLAARQAFRAIRHAQRAGRWLSAESTAPGLRASVIRAMALVDQHRREICDSIFAPLVQRFGADAMERVAGFVAIQLGELAYTPFDSRQRPTSMPFPGLPQSPYIDKRRLPGILELEASTPEILAELHNVLRHETGREKVFENPALAREFLHGDLGSPSWDGYYFYRHGQRNDTNGRRCPLTMAAVDALSLARVPGHGPEVLFSTLGPGTHLLPHHGVTNTRLVCHLPLIVPPECALRVAGEVHAWRVGEAVVFDDTYAHEAWNRSDRIRVVMILDIWHPDLTEAERLAISELQAGLGAFAGPAAH